jgi:hypothetical protein
MLVQVVAQEMHPLLQEAEAEEAEAHQGPTQVEEVLALVVLVVLAESTSMREVYHDK